MTIAAAAPSSTPAPTAIAAQIQRSFMSCLLALLETLQESYQNVGAVEDHPDQPSEGPQGL